MAKKSMGAIYKRKSFMLFRTRSGDGERERLYLFVRHMAKNLTMSLWERGLVTSHMKNSASLKTAKRK